MGMVRVPRITRWSGNGFGESKTSLTQEDLRLIAEYSSATKQRYPDLPELQAKLEVQCRPYHQHRHSRDRRQAQLVAALGPKVPRPSQQTHESQSTSDPAVERQNATHSLALTYALHPTHLPAYLHLLYLHASTCLPLPTGNHTPPSLYVYCMYVRMYLYMHARLRSHIYTRIRARLHTCTHAFMRTCRHACMYTCMQTCVHTHIYV